MSNLIETLPYIQGTQFSELLPFRVQQIEAVVDRMEFVESVVKGTRVLHIGCLDHVPLIEGKTKSGRWFHDRLTSAASSFLGIDINQDGIKILQDKFNISNICYGDIDSIEKIDKITQSNWDYAVFGEVLEHVDNPVAFLKKFSSDYSENVSRIILTVPNAFRIGNIVAAFKNKVLINSDHCYWFSPYTIWKIIHQAGLTVETIQLCKFSVSRGLKGHLKDLLLRRYPLLAENIVVICRQPHIS